MSAVPVVLLVCAAVWSTIALDQVYVSPDNSHSCPSGSTCHNLSYYISQLETYFTSNTIIIFMNGEHQLDKQEPVIVVGADNLTLEGQGEWIAGPEENVMLSTAVINCTSGKGGFTFYTSTSITIRGLTFLTCGTKSYPYDIVSYRSDHPNVFAPYAAVFVMFVKLFQFYQNSIQDNTQGIGLLVWQCDEVKVSNSSFFNTNQSRFLNSSVIGEGPKCGAGTVAFIWYVFNNISRLEVSYSNFTKCNNSVHCAGDYLHRRKDGTGNFIRAHGSTILVSSQNKEKFEANFSHLMFYQNTATADYVSNTGIGVDLHAPASIQITNSFFKHCKNTAHSLPIIMIFAENQVYSLSLKILNIQLLNNSGSNLAIYCSTESINTVEIDNSQFIQTVDTQVVDRGIIISGCKIVRIKNLNMQLQTFDTSFIYDGRNVWQLDFRIENSSFTGNKNIQSTFLLVNVQNSLVLFVTACNFSNNYNGLSVITVQHGSPIFSDILISNNNMTGVTVTDDGYVSFEGLSIIKNNRASEGAGIKLMPNGQVLVSGTLCIYDNIADQGTGGGIYHFSSFKIPVYPILEITNACTMILENSNLKFSGNRAKKGGSDTYGLIMFDCVINQLGDYIPINRVIIPRITTENTDFNSPLVQKYVHFNNTDPLSSMSTDPVMVCFCNTSSHLPQCSNRTHHTSIYPGMEIKSMIATLGYYGGTSPGTVLVNVDNATLVRHYGRQVTVKCFTIHILLANPTPTSALVDIRVMGGLTNWSVSIRVDILECPLGFYEDQGVCKCVPLLVTNNVHCNVSLDPSFNRTGNSWFAYHNNSQCITGVNNCPFDYCNQSNISFDLTTPDRQCVGNRTGILCGQCCSGLSLMLGSNRCAACSNYYLLLLPVLALAGIVLVAILMFLNLTVSVGTINGLLFYANMIKLNEAFFFSSGSVPVVSQFISWLNLDLGIEVCLFNGLDGYWKTWLQFAFPLYLFLLTTGIIIGSHYSVRISRLCGSHAVPALATLFLMSYTKILRTITNALSMSRLTCGNSTLTVWSVDGNIAYGSGKHLPLVIFSCGVLFVGLAYPVLVLCAPLLEKYSDKCIPHRWNPVPTLKPLLDAYGGPYKDRYRFWTGVTLLLRLIVTIIFSFTFGDLVKINMFIISTIIMGILVSWVFMAAVYRNIYLSILDVLFLTNLFLLSNVGLATSLFNVLTFVQEATIIVSVTISILCFIAIVCVHFRLKMQRRRVKCLTQRNRPQLELSRIATDDDKAPETVPGSPADQVYGTERGQHRFVLEFPRPPAGRDMDESPSPVLMEREPLLFDYTD